MTKAILFVFCLVLVAVSSGLPVEESSLVIDIPAPSATAAPASQGDDVQKQKPVKGSDEGPVVEILRVPYPSSSEEDVEEVPFHSIFDVFNNRRPQNPRPHFVFREPAFRNPFDDFMRRPPPSWGFGRPTVSSDEVKQENDSWSMMTRQFQQQLNSMLGLLLPPPPHQRRPEGDSYPRPSYPRPSFASPLFPSLFGNVDHGIGGGSGEVIQVDDLPANYHNFTSEVKEIDGQQVHINKTIKKGSSGPGHTFFSVSSVIRMVPKTTLKPAVESSVPEADVVSQQTPEASSETATRPEDPKMNEIDQLEQEQQRPQQVSGIDAGLLEDNNVRAKV